MFMQKLTNVKMVRTIAMLMLPAPTPMDHLFVLASLATLEMESRVQASIFNLLYIFWGIQYGG
jgi:hypothetical protein